MYVSCTDVVRKNCLLRENVVTLLLTYWLCSKEKRCNWRFLEKAESIKTSLMYYFDEILAKFRYLNINAMIPVG